MAEWLSLTEVASRPGEGLRAVARHGSARVDRADFVGAVQAWRATFAGVEGVRVALHFEDTFEFVCALFGAWHAGKTVSLPGDTRPATLAAVMPTVAACAGALPGALLPQRNAPLVSLPPLDPQAVGVVVHTSGSTGEPAAIAKSLAQLDAEMHTLQAAFGALIDRRTDGGQPVTVWATVSHQHIYGLLFHALWPLAAGRTIASPRLQFPEDMAAALADGPAVLVASPAHLKRLPDTLSWQGVRDGLVAVFSSGGPLAPDAADHAHTLLGHSPIEVFGSSETGGIAWRQRAHHGDRWTALPGIDWRADADGHLAVRSSHLCDDGWFLTADLVAADGDGFVLRGRADRIVKIEEKRVSLTAMERELLAGGDLLEARVVELSGAGGGVVLGVVGVPSPHGRAALVAGKRSLNERLRATLLHSVERVVLPRRFRYVDRLPVNAAGKTPLASLQALFAPARPPVEWLSRGDTEAVASLAISADLRAFDGHFPGTPVLPGVVQVHWAVALAAECFALPSRFLRLDNVKFHRPVVPGMTLKSTLSWRAADGVLKFTHVSDAGPHASGSVVFAVPDDV